MSHLCCYSAQIEMHGHLWPLERSWKLKKYAMHFRKKSLWIPATRVSTAQKVASSPWQYQENYWHASPVSHYTGRRFDITFLQGRTGHSLYRVFISGQHWDNQDFIKTECLVIEKRWHRLWSGRESLLMSSGHGLYIVNSRQDWLSMSIS